MTEERWEAPARDVGDEDPDVMAGELVVADHSLSVDDFEDEDDSDE